MAACLSVMQISSWRSQLTEHRLGIYLHDQNQKTSTAQALNPMVRYLDPSERIILGHILAYAGWSWAQIAWCSTWSTLLRYPQVWMLGYDGPIPEGIQGTKIQKTSISLSELIGQPKLKKQFFQEFF